MMLFVARCRQRLFLHEKFRLVKEATYTLHFDVKTNEAKTIIISFDYFQYNQPLY